MWEIIFLYNLDIDECVKISLCLEYIDCVNMVGFFKCNCYLGFI